jgi:hypothetical protein
MLLSFFFFTSLTLVLSLLRGVRSVVVLVSGCWLGLSRGGQNEEESVSAAGGGGGG